MPVTKLDARVKSRENLKAVVLTAFPQSRSRLVIAVWVIETVSCAAFGMNQGWVEVFVDFAAQTRDVDVNDVGLRVKVVFPHFFEKHGAGDDLSGVAHQVFEQAEFARLQVDFFAAAL